MSRYRDHFEQSIAERFGAVPVYVAPTPDAPAAPTPEPENYRDKTGIAEHFGMSVRWVEHRMQDGMPHSHVDGRARFRLSEVDRWMREGGRLKVSA
jgi:hypothetical protein